MLKLKPRPKKLIFALTGDRQNINCQKFMHSQYRLELVSQARPFLFVVAEKESGARD